MAPMSLTPRAAGKLMLDSFFFFFFCFFREGVVCIFARQALIKLYLEVVPKLREQTSLRKIFAKIEWKDTSKNPTGSKNNSLSE